MLLFRALNIRDTAGTGNHHHWEPGFGKPAEASSCKVAQMLAKWRPQAAKPTWQLTSVRCCYSAALLVASGRQWAIWAPYSGRTLFAEPGRALTMVHPEPNGSH